MRSRCAFALVVVVAGGGCAAPAAPRPAPSISNQHAGGAVRLDWRAVDGDDEDVAITLALDGRVIARDVMHGRFEDAASAASGCAARAIDATHVAYACGAAYTWWEVELTGGEVVVSRVSDRYELPGRPQRRTELARVPTSGTSLE